MTTEDLNKMLNDDFARPIVGCYNYYVTRDAKIISTIKHNGTSIRILKYGWIKGGYLTCKLYEGRKRRQLLVHRMVAQAFIPNPENLPFINHKDEIKTNNNINNLEWCTRQYNNNYGTKNARSALSHIDGKTCKEVAQIDQNGKIIKIWISARNASRNGGYSFKNISACCKGEKKSHLGYYWKFTNDIPNDDLLKMRTEIQDKSKRINMHKWKRKTRQQTAIFQVVI